MRLIFSGLLLLLSWAVLGLSGALASESGSGSEVHAPHAAQLTPETFEAAVLDADKSALVEFFAPWCGHCRELAPEYEKAAIAFEREEDVVVAQVDGDQHRALAQKYQVMGFPTLLFFPALTPKDRAEGRTHKTPVPYHGERTEEELIKFLNTQAGTFRISGGHLAVIAGRLPALDRLLNNYVFAARGGGGGSGGAAALGEIRAKADAYVSGLVAKAEANELVSGAAKAAAARYYQHVFAKVSASEVWLAKETARLEKMLTNGKSVAGAKLDDITRKLNVLHAAVDEKLARSLKNVAARERDEAAKAQAKAEKERYKKADAESSGGHTDL